MTPPVQPSLVELLLAGTVVVLAVLVALLTAAVRRHRRRTQATLARLDARAEEAAAVEAQLRARLDALERHVTPPRASTAAGREYVITRIGEEPDPEPGRAPAEAAPMLPGPAFADQLLRESVVQTASLAAGVRRALTPATRNRIWFEMRREVKRARKQRRTDLRQARREWEARQRAGIDLDGAA